jgi:DNA uptake protein ComE-like DNA-binding protein
LQQIPGIGEAEAARIVAGRPYNSKADLVSRNIVSDSTYAAIKDRIIARPRATPGRSAK